MFLQLPQPQTVEEAIALQESLRARRSLASDLLKTGDLPKLNRVAGVDAAYSPDDCSVCAAVIVLSFPDLKLVESAIAHQATPFPYIPGFLSFREAPVILDALQRLRHLPDLLLCDGQGQAHPRRFGLACHLGTVTNLPAIGVAKTRLLGIHEEVSIARGSWKPLQDRGETVGAVLRTQKGVKPLYLSTGHRIDLEAAISCVLQCSPRYRLPETTRQADRLARSAMAHWMSNMQ